MAQVLPFPNVGGAAVSPIACFLRVGEAHRKLADLYAAGRLPAQRVVIDASRYRHQRELVTALQDSKVEIVLDTEVAELASLAKCGGHSRFAPWAPGEGRPLGPGHFQAGSASEIVDAIARFAVAGKFSAVLAPTHFSETRPTKIGLRWTVAYACSFGVRSIARVEAISRSTIQ